MLVGGGLLILLFWHTLFILKKAEQLLTSIQKEISGNPVSLAAGAFYFVCKSRKMKMPKDEIGEAFNISGRTVYSNEHRISELMSTKSLRL
jgi:hypothetical protein